MNVNKFTIIDCENYKDRFREISIGDMVAFDGKCEKHCCLGKVVAFEKIPNVNTDVTVVIRMPNGVIKKKTLLSDMENGKLKRIDPWCLEEPAYFSEQDDSELFAERVIELFSNATESAEKLLAQLSRVARK